MKTTIKVERAKRDMTQGDLAEIMDVTRGTINSIETKDYSPSVTLALKLSYFFKVPVNDLFILEPGEYPPPDKSVIPVNPIKF